MVRNKNRDAIRLAAAKITGKPYTHCHWRRPIATTNYGKHAQHHGSEFQEFITERSDLGAHPRKRCPHRAANRKQATDTRWGGKGGEGIFQSLGRLGLQTVTRPTGLPHIYTAVGWILKNPVFFARRHSMPIKID